MENYNELAKMIVSKRNFNVVNRKRYAGGVNLVELAKAVGNEFTRGRFVINDDNRFVYENCLNWLSGNPFKAVDPDTKEIIDGTCYKGLYIAGNCGSGKSLLLRILSAIAGYYNVYYEFGTEKIPLSWAENRADDICNGFIMQGAENIVKLRSANVLCINDFGTGAAEQIYMGNRMNIIKQLIEARADLDGKFTIISSNFSINNPTIREQYGDRVVSRLRDMCNYFELKGCDFRNIKH